MVLGLVFGALAFLCSFPLGSHPVSLSFKHHQFAVDPKLCLRLQTCQSGCCSGSPLACLKHVSNIPDRNSSWGALLQPGPSPGPSPGHLSKWQLRPYSSSGSMPGVILDSSLSLPLADLSVNPGASMPIVYPAQPHLTTLVCLQCRRPGFDPWFGKIPWRRKWQPTPVFLPGESHGPRSLVGYSPRGCRVGHD